MVYALLAFILIREVIFQISIARLENKLMSRNFYEYQQADNASYLEKKRIEKPQAPYFAEPDPEVDLANSII